MGGEELPGPADQADRISSPLSGLRRVLRRGRLYATWLIREVPKAPALEIYSRRQDILNRREFLRQQEDASGRGAHPGSFHPHSIPRTIWIYWAQGETAMPHVVRRCVESWRQRNPSWTLRLIDDASLAGVADLSDMPPGLPRRFAANLLRTRLLKRHGGVWADATVYCHRPLDEWLPLLAMTGCFTFDRPGPDRWVSSWFLAAEPEHPMIAAWEDAYGTYLRRLTHRPDKYFMFFYNLQWRLLRDRRAMAAFRQKGGLPASPAFLLMSAVQDRAPFQWAQEAVSRGLPVSKLSWKTDAPGEVFDRFLQQLDRIHPVGGDAPCPADKEPGLRDAVMGPAS